MSLTSALPTLKEDFNKYLENAAYEAFLTTLDEVNENGSDIPSIISSKIKRDGEKSARKFAKKFKEQCANQLAQSIHNYVMSINLTATASGSLISNSIYTPAPVTGMLKTSDFRVF